jgi:predicted membrane protein
MKPLYKQGKRGLFLFVCLAIFSMSLFIAIVDTSIGIVLVSVSLFLTCVAIFLTIYSKDKENE